MNPSISALITTYNRATIVPDAINSVFSQSQPVDELIIIDDGSTDDTYSVISALIKNAPIPCYYIYKNNGGMASSLNRGVKEAKFEYIAFLDDDDLWCKDHIKQSIEILNFLPSVGCVIGLREKDGVLQWPPEKLIEPYSSIPNSTNNPTTQQPNNLLIHKRKKLYEPFYTAVLGTSLIKRDLVLCLGFEPQAGARLDIYFFWLLSELTDIALHLHSHGVARQFRVSYISTDDEAPQTLKDQIMLKRNADEIRMLRKIVSRPDSYKIFNDLLKKALIGRMYINRRAGNFWQALISVPDCIGMCNFKDILKEIILALFWIKPRKYD